MLKLASAFTRLFGLDSPSFDPAFTATSIGITEVEGDTGRHTDPVPVVKHLKSYGVRLLIDGPILLRIGSFLASICS